MRLPAAQPGLLEEVYLYLEATIPPPLLIHMRLTSFLFPPYYLPLFLRSTLTPHPPLIHIMHLLHSSLQSSLVSLYDLLSICMRMRYSAYLPPLL